MPDQRIYLEDDPLWYKDAVIYELHVKAFYDSNDDGIGDFAGLTQKLDYLRDLGITAIWLLPFYPSPLKDDGYDIADYFDVNPDYGTLPDFKEFLKEAHRRGLRVITELVLNHTSDQHAWFQKARRAAPRSNVRDFYVWSDTPDKYADARIIFQDFEISNWTWDNVAKAYYWHRFYSHQPDLNYDNPQVQKAMFKVIDYWMKMGVDGVRLDAVPYLYEREGTNCENLPETYEFLRKLRGHVDKRFKNRMLLAEANQWPEDAVAYFGNGDICNMAFHFPIMPRMFMALQMEDNFPIIDILDQTPPIPPSCQWAVFLRNHDELTLEMVTDEERDYMYRIYAKDPKARINLGIRRRMAPLLGNDPRQIRLLNTLLFTLPGTPVIYYGDELGMGDNYYLGDRDGVRTPMQWSPDRNAGFSRADTQKLYLPPVVDPAYHFASINVDTMERNDSSLLWWMRRFIAMRKHFKVFSRGTMEVLYPDNRKIFAFVREYEGEKILVAVNLSRHAQVVELDLSKYAGYIPEEMFSKNKFIPIKESPYALTFGPNGWYLFLLQKDTADACVGIRGSAMEISVFNHWEEVFEGRAREELEGEVLPAYLSGCRWFGGKARQVQEVRLVETIPIGKDGAHIRLALMNVAYTEGLPEVYVLAIAYAEGEKVLHLIKEQPGAVICRVAINGREGILFDGIYDEAFTKEILSLIARKRKVKGSQGELAAYAGAGFKNGIKGREYLLKAQVLKAEQTNSSVIFGSEFFLKLYRHPDEGLNPDLEIVKFLTEKTSFSHIPAFAGGIEYRRRGAEPIALGILQRYVPNQGDALRYFLDALRRYYENLLAYRQDFQVVPETPPSLLEIAYQEIPLFFQDLSTGVPLEMAGLLGRRTAELHLTLYEEKEDPDFKPEQFSILWQRSVFQSMQSLVKKVFLLLRSNISRLPQEVRGEASEILESEKKIVAQMRAILKKKLPAKKIRIHGDYHLGQVLYTGKDFIIIDFEGEPARTLSERRIKKSPLRDVAGMVRSFHYAAYLALLKETFIRPEDLPFLTPWGEVWYRYFSGAFLRSYLEVIGTSDIIPQEKEDQEIMLNAFLLDKAVYEIGYELNNRPDWIVIPIRGIKHLLQDR